MKTRISRIQRRLLTWYKTSARSLPWRTTRNPYRILISEVMLQQTQVPRVLKKYPLFLKRFPRLENLARAGTGRVLRAWQGMGYNNRAVRLHRLAETVVTRHRGIFPRSIEELRALPGVGRYTAHAIACFAFGDRVPVVDTNVRRVLSRLFAGNDGNDEWALATRVLPKRKAYEWNQALMDFGSAICTVASPKCGECVLRAMCPSAFRVKRARKEIKREPRRDGIPNRIYRGRVVETLRGLNGRGVISSDRLARLVKPDFSLRDRRWFNRLLDTLRRDGLVSVRGRFVSLPS